MNGKTIDQKIEWLFNLNTMHSDEFIRTRSLRRWYRSGHPTEMSAFKCMDGRINIPYVTNTPLGIIRPYRNLGGYFDLGWPLLGEDIMDWVEFGIQKGSKSLILVTYHYSEGDIHRGCAGFDHDHERAFKFTVDFFNQVNRFFGQNNQVVFPIVVGLETDTDSLIFHPQDVTGKNIIRCTEKMSVKENSLLSMVNNLYPDMDSSVQRDLLPLIAGNINHIKSVKAAGRDLEDMQHKEWVLGVGRGFDWLLEPNTALLVGPFDPDLSTPISKAAGIIANNMQSGRISNDGFVVLSSAPFRQNGVDRNRAVEKANFFRRYTKKIIENNYPELADKARYIAVVVNEHTRRAYQLPEVIC